MVSPPLSLPHFRLEKGRVPHLQPGAPISATHVSLPDGKIAHPTRPLDPSEPEPEPEAETRSLLLEFSVFRDGILRLKVDEDYSDYVSKRRFQTRLPGPRSTRDRRPLTDADPVLYLNSYGLFDLVRAVTDQKRGQGVGGDAGEVGREGEAHGDDCRPTQKRDDSNKLHWEATEKWYYVKEAGGRDYDGWCWPGSSSYPEIKGMMV